MVVDQSLHRGQEVADLEALHTQMEALEVDHIQTVADQEVHFENQ